MKIIKIFSVLILPLVVLIVLLLVNDYRLSFAEDPKLSTVMFYVQWYDVGETALEGLDGIKRVDKGFHNFKEINTVYYGASSITIEEMKDALGKAGTYRGIVK